MTQPTVTSFPRTIGMDLGARKSSYCIVDPSGDRLSEGVVKTTRADMQALLEVQPASRVVIEACGPCHWVAMLAIASGHEVIVANPREFRLIAESHRKCDRNDARILADFGQFRPHLLRPVELRGVKCQTARSTLAARAHVVRQRTLVVNLVRAQIRNSGEALPTCSAASFHKRVGELIPSHLRGALAPLLDLLQALARAIATYDTEIDRLCSEEFPETSVLRQVNGVGPNTALAYVATIEDPKRFARSRDVGPYVGLVSKSRSSGSKEPELRISKRGDRNLRRLLVSAATYILTRGTDSDLKRYGERIQGRGGQASRAKARIAVARKLGVLLHRLMITGEVYEPLRNHSQAAA